MKQYCFDCMNELSSTGYCPNCNKNNTADTYPHHLRPGTILNNKYLIGNCLGEGGFGITYIGRDLTLDIRVAIKEYFPNGYVNRNNTATQLVTATSEHQREIFSKGKDRFLMEARSLARFIGEPGIVDVRDYFEANNTAYIIMDYLDGESLSSYLKKHGTMPAQTAFSLILPVVDSLQKIHRQELIHRDISPDNIMLTKKNKMVLMDFGSARYFSGKEKEMSVMLKQGYAPEEQYRKNGNQGPWTDVYGLCATLYKCITGVIPEDALDRMRQDDLKPPSQMGVQISKSLETALMFGLSVYQENRCQDMSRLSEMIRWGLDHPDAQAGQAGENDPFRTQVIDPQYGAIPPVYPNNGGYNANNGGYNANNGGYVPNNGGYSSNVQQSQPEKKGPSMKTVVVVLVVSMLVIIGVMTAVIITLMNSDKDKRDDSSSSTASSVSKIDPTDPDSEDEAEADEKKEEEATITSEVDMPSCINFKYSVAKQNLEKLGLKVKVSYKNDESVPKDSVIEQSPAQGTTVEKGTTVALVVSKGSAACPYDYSQKLVVKASGSYGTATLYEWQEGEFKKTASYSCSVGSNGIGEAQEGSKTTPRGEYYLGKLFVTHSVSFNYFNTYTVTSNTCVDSDVNSPQYNMVLERSRIGNQGKYDYSISEGLLDGDFNYIIYIEHNGSGFSSQNVVKGRGSAIGLRGKYGSLSDTYADIDISAGDMEDLLSRLDSGKNPKIFIGVE